MKTYTLIKMRNLGLLILSLVFANVQAQDTLFLDDAMKFALQNNLGIKMTTNQQERAENAATIGNAGLLPKVDFTGGISYNESEADVVFAGNNPPLNNAESKSLSYNGSLGASYILFNGLGSINSYKKLKSQADLSAIQLRLNIESTLFQVANIYYEVARQQEQLTIAQSSLQISRERYERVKVGQKYGTVSSLAVLNAEVDMNADSSNVLIMRLGVQSAKRNLNVLLNMDRGIGYYVNPSIAIDNSIGLDSLKQKAFENNANLLLSQTNISVAEYSKKIQHAFYMPRVAVNASYGYNYSESNTSVVLNQNSLGFTGGASLAWNLFDGFKKNTALQNAKIALQSSGLKTEEAKLTVNKDVLNSFDLYENKLALLKVEERSVIVAQANFDRSKELFGQGQLTTTEFRQAQLNLNRAKSRLNTTAFTAKMAEIELLRLSGDLIEK